MISFKQFLKEGLSDRVYHNTSIAAIKNLAKELPGNSVRFIIDKNWKIHTGNATKWIHIQLDPENGDYSLWKAYGYVTYDIRDSKYYYVSNESHKYDVKPLSLKNPYASRWKLSFIFDSNKVNEIIQNIHLKY